MSRFDRRIHAVDRGTLGADVTDEQEQRGAEYSNEALRKLGARIRHYRRKRAMTQRDLSFDGCSYSYLARIEAGDRRPSPRVLYEIARRLDVSSEELTGETSTEQRSQSLETLEAAMLIRQGHLEEASELLEGVLQEAQVSADSERASEALEGLGLVALAPRRLRHRGAACWNRASRQPPIADPGERTALYSGLVEVHAHTGDTARAMAVLENCLDRLRRSPVADPAKVRALLTVALAQLRRGRRSHPGRCGAVRCAAPRRRARRPAQPGGSGIRTGTGPRRQRPHRSGHPPHRSRAGDCTTSGTTTGRCASRTWCMPRRSWTSPT